MHLTAGAFVAPKPVHGLPVLVSAGSSPSGIAYAAKHSDLIFATSPTGAEPEKACASLPQRIASIKAQARQQGRKVKVLANPRVVCRPSEREARAWRQHSVLDWAVGGNLHLVGTPEQIVEWFVRLRQAGVDGVHLTRPRGFFGKQYSRIIRTRKHVDGDHSYHAAWRIHGALRAGEDSKEAAKIGAVIGRKRPAGCG